MFDQPASLISFGAIVELLERSAHDLACPDFGLRLAERQDIGILGPLAVAMRYSATVGDAMRCASKYIYVYNAADRFLRPSGQPTTTRRSSSSTSCPNTVLIAPR